MSQAVKLKGFVKHDGQILRFWYALSDSWVACSENIQFVVEDFGRNFIMSMKENRKFAMSKEDKANGKYISNKEPPDFNSGTP